MTFPRRKGKGAQKSRCDQHRNPAYRFRVKYSNDPNFHEKEVQRNRKRRLDPDIRSAERETDRERKRIDRQNPQRREKHNQIVRELRATPEGRKYLSVWRHKNPDKVQFSRGKRKASAAVGKGFSECEWQELKLKYGNRCVGCGKTEKELLLLNRHLVPDHVVPIAHPSTILWGFRGDISNIQPLCHCRTLGSKNGCNNKKSMKIIDYRPSFAL